MKENNKELPIVIQWPLTQKGLDSLKGLIKPKKGSLAAPAKKQGNAEQFLGMIAWGRNKRMLVSEKAV